MPALPRGPVYDKADPQMQFQVIHGSDGPGLVSLGTLRQISESVEAGIAERVAVLEAIANADRQEFDQIEAGMANGLAEMKAADSALQSGLDKLRAGIVPFTASIVLAANVVVLAGKSTRTVAVAGLKRGDNLVVTANAALPATVTITEAYCLADNVLTLTLVNTSTVAVSLASALTVPLGIIALRP